ncbi:MAG TPA: MarR family transcriptional regulator [Polyangiaceae bacterium]|nr:MarR family transcriptional regulator [Polyangiaceae bacterium]
MVESKPVRRAAVPSDGLVDGLVRTSFFCMAVLNKIGAENDLSLTQLRVCGILRDRRVRMAELAEYLGLEKSTMSGLIDRAEKRGLVARSPSPEDRRAIDVYLTSEGAALVKDLYAQVRQSLAHLTSRLGASDQRQLEELLRRMLDAPGG